MFPRDQDEQRRVMYEAQLRNNELLEQLIQLQTKPTAAEIKPPVNKNQAQTKKPTVRGKRT